jgi:hypothetical protein
LATQHVQTTIRYDGPGLVDHAMDVQELAPALLALAEMIQLTNQKYNGDRASMKVLVKADPEQKCFQLDIQIFQSLLETARHLFSAEDYKTAKEIAELLDLILPGGVAGGVFVAWRKLFGKKADEEAKPLSSYEVEQHGGVTIINNFYGDGNSLELETEVYNLATDPQMAALGAKVLQPLEREGYDTIEFEQGDERVVEVRKDEARRIIARAPSETAELAATPPPDENMGGPSHVDGQVKIKTAVYDGEGQWDLWWTGRTRKMKVEDREWVAAFQRRDIVVPPGSWLDVHMIITPPKEPGAQPTIVVTEVKGVIPPEREIGLFYDDPA